MKQKTLLILSVVVISAFIASMVSAGDQSVTLTTWKDKTVNGKFDGVSSDGKSILVQTDSGQKKFQVEKLLKMEFTGGGITTRKTPVEVQLTGGDKIVGSISKSLGAEGFQIKSPDLPKNFDISLKKASSILFKNNKPEGGSVEEVDAENNDVLYKVDGDYYVGFLDKLGPKGAEFSDNNLGKRQLSTEEIHRIELTKIGFDLKIPKSAYLKVHARSGSVFIGAPVAGEEDSLTLKNLYGNEWNLPYENISSIIIKNGRTTFLSDLKPSNTVQRERFLWEPEKNAEKLPPRYRWQKDESVPKIPGQTHQIQIHGQTYRKGISCTPYTKLTYDLNGEFNRFQSTIGIDDRAKHPKYEGSVVFRVYVDGKKEYDSKKLSYSEFPKKVDVDVKGADSLTLEVDLGEGFLDFADWAGARLIR